LLARPGAAEAFPQTAPLLRQAASQIDFALTSVEEAESVEAAGRYVVARIRKTYEPGGEHPGPQHVAKTFVPYDTSIMSKRTAEASARGSNHGHLYGRAG
jgi:hypothetical protein